MKSLVVYFSKFGNTQRVAEVVAEVLASSGPVRLVNLDEIGEADLQAAELVVMGSPTHRMNLPESVTVQLRRLPRRVLRGTPFAAYDTSYKMSPWLAHFTAARKLTRRLRRLGGRRVISPETFHVTAREGPLYEGELQRAKVWASSVLHRAEQKRSRGSK